MNPILKPLRMSSAVKPARYCLDVHTHFFNGSDVNAKGYFEGGVVRDLRPKELQGFARLMGPLIDQLTEFAPTARQEFDLLQQRARRPFAASSAHPLQDVAETHREKVAGALAKVMRDNKVHEEFLRLRRSAATRFSLALPAKEAQEFSDETVLNAIDPRRRLQKHRELYGLYAAPVPAADPGGYLEFIGHILSYRFMNLRDYQEFYSERDGVPAIDGVFSSLVDFDYWLDCPTESSREDQVKLHSLLAALSGGYMMPLVAYNPWTDIEHPGNSLDLVQRAVRDYGFVGVKIYPANGFFAYGNSYPSMQVKTTQRRPDLRKLDDRLLAMFTWCAEQGVPVMAHTDESMGADLAADEFGGPRGWIALLEKMKGGPAPVINVAHFGGDDPGVDHPDNTWPADFAALFRTEQGRNLYADLGYWTALCSCDTWSTEGHTAIDRLRQALGNPQAGQRIMYGTDWFMISTVHDWGTYLTDLATRLRGLSPELTMENLFYRNAIRCFGLGHRGAQRDRVLSHYSRMPGGAPAWLQIAQSVPTA